MRLAVIGLACSVLGIAGCAPDAEPHWEGDTMWWGDAAWRSDAGLDGRAGDFDAPSDLDAPSLELDAGLDARFFPIEDAGPAPEGCITDVLRGGGHAVFTCGPITYDVEVPAMPCSSLGGCGLVLDVHGATMTAATEDLNTNLRALGSAAGYVVVQPTAPGSWWTPATHDDLVFDFVTLAMRAFRIDPDRVHVTGFSQGGFMTWRMLCDHADVLASVAPGAACGALFPHCPFTASERPSREIPVLYMHGTADPIVAGCRTAMRDAVVAGWSMALDTFVEMDASHTWTRYRSPTGNVFEHVEHDYRAFSSLVGGHCYPGSPDIGTSPFGTTNFGCVEPVAFDWGEIVMAFFVAHPRG